MGFWEKYEQLCTEHGLKPQSEEIMKACGVSSPAITAWKKGSKPKFETMARIAAYFHVDVRYLLDLTDSPYGDDVIAEISEKLRIAGVEIESLDEGKGAGQEYVLTYEGKSFNYQKHEFSELCQTLMNQISDAEIFTVDKFCREVFGGETNVHYDLSDDEYDLITNYRQLTADGQTMVKASLISELRRTKAHV